MRKLLDAQTIRVMGLACAAAAFLFIPGVKDTWAGYICARLLFIGETLFHEMGHTVVSWLFGTAAIPSIMTVIGSEKAGGATVPFGHSWVIQIGIWYALAWYCNRLREDRPALFIPVSGVCLLAVALAFTPYTKEMMYYMGYGGAVLSAGVLLYRAWLGIIVRNEIERWFNALFGFFILFDTLAMCRQLMTSETFRSRMIGMGHDFYWITETIPHWRIEGLATFLLAQTVLTLVLSFVFAVIFYEDEHYRAYE